MLHIPGILDCTYHLHVSCLCAQGSSIAEYLDYSRSCKKRHLRACVPVRFARVHTPKLHLRGQGGGGGQGAGGGEEGRWGGEGRRGQRAGLGGKGIGQEGGGGNGRRERRGGGREGGGGRRRQ